MRVVEVFGGKRMEHGIFNGNLMQGRLGIAVTTDWMVAFLWLAHQSISIEGL